MERVVVFGSGNRPTTLAHQAFGQFLRTCGKFDTVLWCPYGYSYEKVHRTPPLHMMALAMLAFPRKWMYQSKPKMARFVPDIRTAGLQDMPIAARLHQLQAEMPDVELWFATGSDRLTSIHTWDEFEFLRQQHMVIVPRPESIQPGDFDLRQLLPNAEWLVPPTELPNISSTEVRRRIVAGDPSWKDLVNKKIARYIQLHHLFEEGNS